MSSVVGPMFFLGLTAGLGEPACYQADVFGGEAATR